MVSGGWSASFHGDVRCLHGTWRLEAKRRSNKPLIVLGWLMSDWPGFAPWSLTYRMNAVETSR